MKPDVVQRLREALASRYVIECELGAGGMATVYLAKDVKHHRHVAIKVLSPELAHTLGTDRFLREIEVAAGLDHPHIVAVHDSGEADGFLFFVMPLVEGESLRARLTRECQLPLDDALQIAREVADAIGYAHSQGLIHRDIKPENILLSGGHARVADFGIARAITVAGGNRLTDSGVAVGTPAYMSPEQSAGGGDLDGRSDLYSLGCVLYEMLAGEPPFDGPSAQVVIAKRLSEPVPRISALRETVPVSVEAVITKALARAPADRFRTAFEFIEAVRRATRGEAAPAARRTQWRATVIGGALMLLTALLVATAVVVVPASRRAILVTLLTRHDARLDPRRIVVAPLDNRTGDTTFDDLGDLAAHWITRALIESGQFDVVDERTAFVTARIVDRFPTSFRAGDPGIALAHETDAGRLVSGSIFAAGESLWVELQLSDVASTSVLRVLDPVSGHSSKLSDLVSAVGRRAVASLAQSGDTTMLGQATAPPSFEAFREVTRAWEAFLKEEHEDALVHLERARALDSTYLTPRVIRAVIQSALFLWPEADSTVRSLQPYADRLSVAERLALDLVAADLAGDLTGRLRVARDALHRFPGSPELTFAAAQAALRLNRPSEALDFLASMDPERGVNLVSHLHWYWQAQAFHQLGDHKRELKVTRRGLRRFPGRTGLERSLVGALAALGRADELELLRHRRAHRPGTVERRRSSPAQAWLDSRHWLDLVAIRELRAHDHPEVADEALSRVLAEVEASVPDSESPAERSVYGELLYEADRWDEARAVFTRLVVEDSSDTDARGYLGVIAARTGDTVLAEQVADELATLEQPYLRGEHTAWRAHIAAVLGRRQQAVRLLREAVAQGKGYRADGGTTVHNHPDFVGLRMYAPFDDLVATQQ